MGELGEALTLIPVGEGEWRVHADPRYEAGVGMFGGWTAAVVMRSITDDERRLGQPVALTVNFVRAVPAGHNVRASAAPLSSGRSIQHWRVELHDEEDGQLLTQAIGVASVRPVTDGFCEDTFPEAPDPDTLDVIHPPGEFGQRVLVRPVFGVPFIDQPTTRSLLWVREMSGRPADALQLAFLSDAYPPRILYASQEMRFSVTLMLSVYLHATAAELDAVGDAYVLNEAVGTRGADGTAGQQARLWSPGGVLLATTEQLCWYK